jgi:hypothetical protein
MIKLENFRIKSSKQFLLTFEKFIFTKFNFLIFIKKSKYDQLITEKESLQSEYLEELNKNKK